MSEVTPFTGNNAAARLVEWAEAASSAHALAQSLCRTAFVPEQFRIAAGETEETRRDNEIRIGNATAALLLGAELGLDPIASLRALYVIRGQVAIYARMKLALLYSRGHKVWVEVETDERIVVAGHRKDDEAHVQKVEWDQERARRAGFTRNDLYRTNPRAMLFARASSELAARLAPDVLAGIPEETAEELGARLTAPETAPEGVTVQRAPRAPREPRIKALTPIPVPPEHTARPETQRLAEARAAEERQEQPEPEPEPEKPQDTLPIQVDEEPRLEPKQRAYLHVLYKALGWRPPEYHAYLAKTLGRAIESTNDLTVTEASFMIDNLKAYQEAEEQPR